MRPPGGASSRYAALRHEVGPRSSYFCHGTNCTSRVAAPRRSRIVATARIDEKERGRPPPDLDANVAPGGRKRNGPLSDPRHAICRGRYEPAPAVPVGPDLVFDQGAEQDEPAGPLAAFLRVEPRPGPRIRPSRWRRCRSAVSRSSWRFCLRSRLQFRLSARRRSSSSSVGGRRGMLIAMMSLLAPLRRPPPARRERPPRTGGPAESTRRLARRTRRDAVPRPRWRPPCS